MKVINGGSANLAFFDRHRLTAKKSLEFSNKFIETALNVASNFATEAYVRFCWKPQLIGMTVRGRPTQRSCQPWYMPKSSEWFCRERYGHDPGL